MTCFGPDPKVFIAHRSLGLQADVHSRSYSATIDQAPQKRPRCKPKYAIRYPFDFGFGEAPKWSFVRADAAKDGTTFVS